MGALSDYTLQADTFLGVIGAEQALGKALSCSPRGAYKEVVRAGLFVPSSPSWSCSCLMPPPPTNLVLRAKLWPWVGRELVLVTTTFASKNPECFIEESHPPNTPGRCENLLNTDGGSGEQGV